MERYTYFEDDKWRIRVGDTEYSGPWVDRLAAYEDKIPFDRLDEIAALVKAQDEGRVVVLNGEYTGKDGEEALRVAMYHCSVTNNPVTRYTADAIAEKLTRAEAEAAIGGGGDG